jgi:GNAT superfamily N-acetyltransferase
VSRIVEQIEIARRPEDVFAYIDDLGKHGEWQEQIVSTRVETEGPTHVGSRATDKRRLPGGAREITYEIIEHDPPRKASFRGVNGPVRPVGTITVEPIDDGSHSRMTLEFDFQGHGIGKLLVPLAVMNARKEIPKSQARLKERLEQEAMTS